MTTNGILKRIETRVLGWVRLPPPSSRLRRLTFWFGALALLLVLLSLLPGHPGAFFEGLRAPVVFIFAVCALIVAVGWTVNFVRNKLLWRLSHRLVVTYLLVGFAPVFLFLILAGLAGYVFAGQF